MSLGSLSERNAPAANRDVRTIEARGTNLDSLTQTQLLDNVRVAFVSAFSVDPQSITLDTVPTDVSHWDSMGHVTLATCLEEVFGLTLDVDDLMAMESVRDICRILQSKIARESR